MSDRFLLCLLFALIGPFDACAQHLINLPSVLARNRVDTLTITICHGEGCLQETWDIDAAGRPVRMQLGTVAVYLTWSYDKSERLIISDTWAYADPEDELYSESTHHYTRRGQFLFTTTRRPSEHTDPDTTHTPPVLYHECNACTKDALGRFVIQPLGDLFYPCGVEYKGDHRAEYHYASNGLIEHCRIFNNQGTLEVELAYTYSYRRA